MHARGAGAYGTFTVTADVTPYTRAAFLSEVGRRTETFLRLSTVAGNLGAADAVRDPRGWALSGALAPVSREDVVERAIENFRRADDDFGKRLAAAVQNLRG